MNLNRKAKLQRSLWIALLVVLALSLAGYIVLAADSSANPIAQRADRGLVGKSLTGIVQSYDGTTLVIGGISIDASAAVIDGLILVGEEVKVTFTVNDQGAWVALEIETEEDRFDNDNADNDNNDDDDNNDDNDADNDDNADGNDDNGDNDNADDNNDDADLNELRLIGTLETVGQGFIVVSGLSIDVSTADIDDRLIVGEVIRVDFQVVNGAFVADEVRSEDDNSGPGNGDDDDFDNDNSDFDNADNDNADNGDDDSGDRDNDDDDDNSGPGNGGDDGSGDQDDNSGPSNGDDDDNSGPGNGDQDDQDDDDDDGSGNSGSGGGDSGSGSGNRGGDDD